MLSILIPIYEVKVEKLVNDLIRQCLASKIEFEIICFDDCSSLNIKLANRSIDLIMGVNYVELSENVGRARIRNLLTKMARYDYLLFLDCDSKIQAKDFISTYLKHLKEETVITGGRIYDSQKPKSENKLLHWVYGTQRESKNAAYRLKNKVTHFHSNNFVAHRHILLENPFDEKIEGYGYEDLSFANQIDQRGVKIVHIDNPVLHDKLEDYELFLERSLRATENLWNLFRQGKVPYTSLIKAYKFLDSYYFTKNFISFYNKREGRIMNNLKSQQPRMWNFDLMRLAYFIKLSQT